MAICLRQSGHQVRREGGGGGGATQREGGGQVRFYPYEKGGTEKVSAMLRGETKGFDDVLIWKP